MKIIVLGATSAIAEATARLYAAEGAELLLVGRHGERLAAIAADLRLRRGSRVEIATCDLAQASDAMAALASLPQRSAASTMSWSPTASSAIKRPARAISPRLA